MRVFMGESFDERQRKPAKKGVKPWPG